jgi:hypothetical protein
LSQKKNSKKKAVGEVSHRKYFQEVAANDCNSKGYS